MTLEPKQLIKELLSNVFEGKVKWTLPEADEYRQVLGSVDFWKETASKNRKELRRQSRSLRRKLRHLDYSNATKFHTIRKDKAWGREIITEYKVDILSDDVVLHISRSQYFTLEEKCSSKEIPEIAMLVAFLRDPKNIIYHPESKHVKKDC